MSKLVTGLERAGLVRRYPDWTTRGRSGSSRLRGRTSRLDLLERLLSEATDDEIEAVRVAAEAVERALRA